jgi:hypothetical protein
MRDAGGDFVFLYVGVLVGFAALMFALVYFG